MAAPEVSHGRGGAGNINPDDTKYTDAGIVRVADEGTGVSTGRGGAANIIGENATASKAAHDIVPDAATRPSTDNLDYHVGRGGAGNEHHAPGHEHHKDEKKPEAPAAATKEAPTGLADKLKNKLLGAFKK